MRAARLVPLLACAAMAAAPTAGHAAAPAPQISDKTGDANAVNGQGVVNGAPGDLTTSPASVASLDIVSVQFATTGTTTTSKVRGKVRKVFTPDGFKVTMTLAGAPDVGVYRVRGVAGGCSIFWFQYFADPVLPGASLRHNCAAGDGVTSSTVDLAVPATVSDNTITWAVKLRALPKAVKLGTLISDLNAETRATLVAVTVPRVDEAVSDKTYKVGS